MSLDKFKIAMQYAMPKHFISRVVGKLAAAKAGALTTTLIKLFIKFINYHYKYKFYLFPEVYRGDNTKLLPPKGPYQYELIKKGGGGVSARDEVVVFMH